jgi:hypothetical protein
MSPVMAATCSDCPATVVSASSWRLSFFQSRRLRCSARKAGTDETVVRPAAIRSSVMRTSNNSTHFEASAGLIPLPVNCFEAVSNAVIAFVRTSKFSNGRFEAGAASSSVFCSFKSVFNSPVISTAVPG